MRDKLRFAAGAVLPLFFFATPGYTDITVDDGVAVGNAGAFEPNGIVTEAPSETAEYYYVSTFGGVLGAGALEGVGGTGFPTNGSTLSSKTFTANAGDSIVFHFNHVTSDGAGYADYSWARLLNADDGSQRELLFTARTTPGGNTVPGFAMPAPTATLEPPRTPIIPGGPVWDQLGPDSGRCFSAGCGHTDWVKSTYEISEAGNYRLEFGSTNWNDNAYDTGMAIAEATPDFTPVPGAKDDGPASPRLLVGDVDEKFDPNKPTVIVTHGWQPTGAYDGTIENVSFTKEFAEAIADRTGGDVNVVGFVWDDAYDKTFSDFIDTEAGIDREIDTSIGVDLGIRLAAMIGKQAEDYSQPIHMIGHSWGSAVNARAAKIADRLGLEIAQVTTLDAPIGYSIDPKNYERLVGRGDIPLLDNYFGTASTKLPGVVIGSPIDGWEIDGGTPYDTDHSGVWETYLDTINLPVADGFFYSAVLGEAGGYETLAKPKSGTISAFDVMPTTLTPTSLISASYSSSESILDIATASNGYASFLFEVPENVEGLMFDMFVEQAGVGDWLEVVFDDELRATFDMSFYEGEDTPVFIDLFGLPAGTQEGYFLLVDNAGTGSSLTASNLSFLAAASPDVAPVPLPASAVFLVLGVAALGLVGRRRKIG